MKCTWRRGSLKGMFLQAFLCSQMHLLTRLLRDKLCAIVDKHQALILNVYDHIRFAITIHIPEFRGNWCQILTIPKKSRSIIDSRMRCIPPRQFDNHYVPVEVEKDKV